MWTFESFGPSTPGSRRPARMLWMSSSLTGAKSHQPSSLPANTGEYLTG
ncbi:hypothetical protein [Amycolatopsis thailandensis]|nr:hypothetical protein [Amycolatopsis thailandensis]